mmetsp:Transcript_17817/g.17199  ORF Transcript_17817/g.17199 Transcript_17817/m.17199 type:complete len:95 (+) Transcript_17817:100-384(+)|eukprot:CAMPEP_0197826822 /NCGR_PEP_ID=MMETSP1437-20131217/3725_1 /TAXON_ID=49252 ORGANISM="Eucampia antarctica, Strain CCMP1452" /NCGR_SAMPLE_ID=MMETSP1437 /ASSEMBLY_ACC=CAM_ASM_001096 /LENGTH=94 /DNA_ID=CAMNT_0043427417 /DNA_START=90 /DNA_END=374 /DNA_ORIENTATION=+
MANLSLAIDRKKKTAFHEESTTISARKTERMKVMVETSYSEIQPRVKKTPMAVQKNVIKKKQYTYGNLVAWVKAILSMYGKECQEAGISVGKIK